MDPVGHHRSAVRLVEISSFRVRCCPQAAINFYAHRFRIWRRALRVACASHWKGDSEKKTLTCQGFEHKAVTFDWSIKLTFTPNFYYSEITFNGRIS